MGGRRTTRSWALLTTIHIALGCGILLASCTGPAIPAQPASKPAVRAAVRPAPPNDVAIRTAAHRELGPEVASTMPQVVKAEPQTSDPGARQLVESMLVQLGQRSVGIDGTTVIGVGQIRNQSHATASEYAELCKRLADVLTRASADSRVKFSADGDSEPQYQILGAAYLANVQGLDVWELYISLSPAKDHWSLWQSDGPVRVLRRPRPGQPQILIER